METSSPSEPKPQRFAKNKDELAKCLGISRTKLYSLARSPTWPKPRADSRWDIEECRAAMSPPTPILLTPATAGMSPVLPDGFTTQQEYLTAIKAAREKIKLARDEGQVADKGYVTRMLKQGLNKHMLECKRILLSEIPPRIAGCDAITIETILREVVNDIFKNLGSDVEALAENPVPPETVKGK